VAQVRVVILRAAGTNCDVETQFAWEAAGAAAEPVHVRRLIERPQLLDQYQVLTIPGGFSYGDDISAGRVMAAQLERHLLERIRVFIEAGKLVLGICNGFQVLVKAGLLPDLIDDPSQRTCTITYNDPPGFQDRWVWLKAGDSPCVFLEPGRRYELPIAHAEGRVAFAGPQVYEHVVRNRQNALCYVEPPVGRDTAAGEAYNPNGSAGDIAGLCDRSGRVLGLMPHPERFICGTQHPTWTSRPPRETGDGLSFFQRAVGCLS
jgi:phosphoribosylformylglycinamidine synthase I